jgi:hypothetical protein
MQLVGDTERARYARSDGVLLGGAVEGGGLRTIARSNNIICNVSFEGNTISI